MTKQPNKKLIGLFLLTSLVVFAGIITNFIAGKVITNNHDLVVMYFDESVSGLNVGAPVVFMGVEIGKVVKIDLIANPDQMDFNIPVYAKFAARKNVQLNGFRNRTSVLNELIQKGLRARLTTQSYLTGQLMIELEMLPGTPIVLKHEDSDLFEIPTILSQMGQLSKGIQDLPLRNSVIQFNTVMEKMDKELIPALNKLVGNINTLISHNSKETTKLIYNANQTLQDISMAAKSIRNLTDYLEQHPESLLKGKGGH
ncbi:MAG: MlaD family protein [Alphaproteobacteria bacterium]